MSLRRNLAVVFAYFLWQDKESRGLAARASDLGERRGDNAEGTRAR
jgi:hypothetical protein